MALSAYCLPTYAALIASSVFSQVFSLCFMSCTAGDNVFYVAVDITAHVFIYSLLTLIYPLGTERGLEAFINGGINGSTSLPICFISK